MPYLVELPDLDDYQRAIRCQAACPVRTDARAYVTAIAADDMRITSQVLRNVSTTGDAVATYTGSYSTITATVQVQITA